jgi:hypothetical protein
MRFAALFVASENINDFERLRASIGDEFMVYNLLSNESTIAF